MKDGKALFLVLVVYPPSSNYGVLKKQIGSPSQWSGIAAATWQLAYIS